MRERASATWRTRDVLVRQADEARGRATIRRSVSTRPAREAQRHKLDGAIERVVVEIEQIADHDRERREGEKLARLVVLLVPRRVCCRLLNKSVPRES